MRIVCGYVWGLWWWRTSAAEKRIADDMCDVTSLEGCRDGMSVLKSAGLEELRQSGIGRGIPENVRVDIVVPKRLGHQVSKLYARHLTSSATVPSGSLSRIDDGVYVFAPAYCLIQVSAIATRILNKEVANEFAEVIVAKVACELCGSYSLRGSGGMTQRVPLTTVGEIAAACLAKPKLRGVGRVLSVLPYVIENTRSPKETDVALLLCLPPQLGGFELVHPLSNVDIDVSGVREGFFEEWSTCNVDFLWPQANLVVEYDSWDCHDEQGEDKVRQDRLRAEALRGLGYTVVTIRRNDLYSQRLFREKAEEIARALSTELPEQTAEFVAANETLRMMLLRHDRWA